jgi:hypothetical protein
MTFTTQRRTRLGSSVAVRDARPAARDAGNRISSRRFTRPKEMGYVEGENLAIQYRWAQGHFDGLLLSATEIIE